MAARSRVIVRAAIAADAPAIAAVHVASWRAAYRGIVPDRILAGLDVQARAEGWRTGIQESPAGDLVAVAEVDGRVCGFVRAGTTPDGEGAAEIHAIYVDPARWGSGIGGALLDLAERELKDRGCARAFLWVFSANAHARRWYERKGWTADGAEGLVDFDGTPVPKTRYSREIAPRRA